jgi:hypothetical protein
VIGMGMCDKDCADVFALEEGKIGQGICFAVNTHPGIDDDPLLCQLYRETTRSDAARSTNKDNLHLSLLNSSTTSLLNKTVLSLRTKELSSDLLMTY